MFGKPSIGCRVGGMKEVIAEGVTGLLAEPGDPESLQSALETLLEDRAKREAFGIAARARYLENYTRETFTNRTLEFYRKVLASTTASEAAELVLHA
jgi:glycosyltransferase involved in cell wall biosynthesis